MAKQIKVSDSTHANLHKIKEANKTGSLDGAIRQMMEGCTTDMDVIIRGQTAFTLTYEGYDNMNVKEKSYDTIHESSRDVTFNELRKADVGDIYEPLLYADEYYCYSIATVVYTDSEFVVLKIITYKELEWHWDGIEVGMLGVYLF